MSDDNTPVSGTMRPAIPSRATGEQKPIVPAGGGLETALSLQVPAAHRRTGQDMIADAVQAHRVARKGRKAKKVNKQKRKAVAAVTKNPNRPLELKSQMQALLEGFRSLKGLEHEAFTNCVLAMQDLSKPGRRHVLDALMKVYAS